MDAANDNSVEWKRAMPSMNGINLHEFNKLGMSSMGPLGFSDDGFHYLYQGEENAHTA
ncbi:MAG: hypothetical protein AAF988_07435 [Pseudomonadota bacterium]